MATSSLTPLHSFRTRASWQGAILLGCLVSFAACSSAKKRKLEFSDLQGKKVALVDVDGEETSRKVVEVALINQLIRKGTFFIIPKNEVEAAKNAVEQDTTQMKELALRAGADLALQAEVLSFESSVREGYSSEVVQDSQLAEERGDDGTTERVYKSKSMEGHVKFRLKFTQVTDNLVFVGIAEAKDRVEQSAKDSSIHLPPRLRFLENLSNKAFRDFFDQYN